MNCKNKEIKVKGIQNSPMGMTETQLHVLITNDSIGKTLRVDNGTIQFTLPMDDIVKYLI